MFRHVVMFRWSDDASPEARDAVSVGLSALPAAIEEIASYRHGPDAGISDGNWDFVVVADFADRAGYEVYRDHPTHVQLVAERIKPLVAARAAVQYELAD